MTETEWRALCGLARRCRVTVPGLCPHCFAPAPGWCWVLDEVEGRKFLTHDGEELCNGSSEPPTGPARSLLLPALAVAA
ncbi:hypothetical protein [Streptacidiphilus cavernicola]|uniref:Uncharacterized protein n=1 Tax=Streptacidiphilus cavernicola TaxID=3342716 RepID=A0ABV6VU87_9ACTN